MGCQNEDYQLLLNNIVQLLKTDWKLAVVLMEGQGIKVNEIPFEGIVDDVVNGSFIINGLSILTITDSEITVEGADQFNGVGFDKKVRRRYIAYGYWRKSYPMYDFKYKITRYLKKNLKNTMNDRIK